MRSTRRVTASDGVSLAVRESGPREAPALVLLHGIAQSAASWDALLDGPLSTTHRLVAVDLRGHGDSDKPLDDASYARPLLGEDLAAVIAQSGLVRPTVVAWSYGGVVLGEYLRARGDGALGAIVLVAAAIQSGRDAKDLYGPVMLGHARALMSDDEAVYLAGSEAFVRGCSASPLPDAEVRRAVEAMGRVPVRVRRALLSGSGDYRAELAATTVPLTTIHGDRDAVVAPAMSERLATLREGVRSEVLTGVGHLPWIEAPDAFVRAL